MKNKQCSIFIIPCIALGLISNAYGLSLDVGGPTITPSTCTKTVCPVDTGTTITQTNIQDQYCYGSDTTYWNSECYKDANNNIFKFSYCNKCLPGFTLGEALANPCGLATGLQSFFPKCQCICSDCVTDTEWADGNTGYQRRFERSCSCSVLTGDTKCLSSYEYRCAAGYYGSSTNGTSGCTQCPTWTNFYTNSARTTLARGTSSGGTSAITGCYIAPGTYYDTTGTFTTNRNCNYE